MFSGVHFVTGPPPRDRTCFECGRIGHIAVNCPRKVERKERKKALGEERKKKQWSSLDEKRKCSQPIRDVVSGGAKEVGAKDVNDNFDYNSLKHMEVDSNRSTIDYLKPRVELASEEPELVILEDVLPVYGAQGPGLNYLDHLSR